MIGQSLGRAHPGEVGAAVRSGGRLRLLETWNLTRERRLRLRDERALAAAMSGDAVAAGCFPTGSCEWQPHVALAAVILAMPDVVSRRSRRRPRSQTPIRGMRRARAARVAHRLVGELQVVFESCDGAGCPACRGRRGTP